MYVCWRHWDNGSLLTSLTGLMLLCRSDEFLFPNGSLTLTTHASAFSLNTHTHLTDSCLNVSSFPHVPEYKRLLRFSPKKYTDSFYIFTHILCPYRPNSYYAPWQRLTKIFDSKHTYFDAVTKDASSNQRQKWRWNENELHNPFKMLKKQQMG